MKGAGKSLIEMIGALALFCALAGLLLVTRWSHDLLLWLGPDARFTVGED